MKKIFTSRMIRNTLILWIYMFIQEMFVRFMMKSPMLDFAVVRLIVSTLIVSLIWNFVFHFFKRGIHKVFNIIFVIAYALLMYVEYGLYTFIGFYMGIANSSQGAKTTSYIKDLLINTDKISLILFAIMLVFVIYYIVFATNKRHNKYETKFSSIPRRLAFEIFTLTVIVFLCHGYYISIKEKRFQNKTQSVSNYSLWLYPENSNLSVNNYGVFIYVFSDIKSHVTRIDADYILNLEMKEDESQKEEKKDKPAEPVDLTRKIDDTAWNKLVENTSDSTYKTLNTYFMSRDITSKNDMTGIFKGKNLIIILLESTNEISILNPDDFPTLTKIYNEGISFRNNFSPRNNCSTGNNEFTVLSSLYTINNTCTANSYGAKSKYLEGAYGVFKRNGYTTTGFHDYSDYFYYRNKIHPNLGADKFYDAHALGIKINTGLNAEGYHNEWPSDVELFQKAKDKYMTKDQKFFAYFAAVTTHQTYYDSSEMGNKYIDNWKDTNYPTALKRYLSKMKVVDDALAELLSELESEGILDDTVIALFGDHFPYGLTDSQINKYLEAQNANYRVNRNSTKEKNVDRTPLVIYNSSLEKGIQVTKYTTIVDLLPTLMNMFDVEYDPRLYLGTDIFSDTHQNRAYFADASWQDEKGFYYAPTGKMTYFDENNKYSDDELLAINKEIKNKKQMSNSAIRSKYFNYLMDGLEKYKPIPTENNTPEGDNTNTTGE